MDIASVYLNFASLLGTEIEVEGYYHAEAPTTVYLYEIEYELNSERIFLPQSVRYRALIEVPHGFPLRAKVFLKGRLTQNALGDPYLSHISSISYRTEDVVFNATLTYKDQEVTCRHQTDLVFNWLAYFQAVHRPIRDITLASSIVSQPVLLEGYLWHYADTHPNHTTSLMMAADHVIYDVGDLWRPNKAPSISDVVQAVFGRRVIGKIPEQPQPKYLNLTSYAKIWIPGDLQTSNIHLYFGERRVVEDYRTTEDTKFAFAGTVDTLDEPTRWGKNFPPQARLVFKTIDYIATRRVFTFQVFQGDGDID